MDLNELYQKAASMQQNGHFVEAIQVYDQMLEHVPDDADVLHLKGLCFYQLGDLAAAERHISKGFDYDTTNPSHYSNYGAVLISQGKAKEAKAALEKAVALDPSDPDAYCNLSSLYQQLGQISDAEKLIRDALEKVPNNPSLLNNLGCVLKENGKLEEAETTLFLAYETDRNILEVNINLGDTLRQNGKLDEAYSILEHAQKLSPLNPETLNNMGLVLFEMKRLEEAGQKFLQVIQKQPDHVFALRNLGNVYMELGLAEQAVMAFNEAVKQGNGSCEAYTSLGGALLAAKKIPEAEAILKQAVILGPQSSEPWQFLGEAARANGKFDEAISCWNKSIELDPQSAETLYSFASLYAYTGDSVQAVDYFRKALAKAPKNDRIHSNLLMALHYAPDISRQEIFEDHLDWVKRHVDNDRPRPEIADKSPDRPLRIGFVSADFRFHATAFFFLEALKQWPKNGFETFLYSNLKIPDRYTEQFKEACDNWREIYSDSDYTASERIRNDKIDILIDMNGHTKTTRLALFASRPAPVQISWFDYVDTTGLKAMDYYIGDSHQIPVEDEKYWVEKIYRLPHDYICYTPPKYAPEVSPAPFEKNGFVALGCFNTVFKLSKETVSVWSAILKRLPDVKLFLNSPEFAKDYTVNRYANLFEKEGIDTSRIIIDEGGQHEEFIGAYSKIDIALDPFPYAGGLNTCEALWMGVPVIALNGERFCSRHAVAHLRTVGCPELVADDTGLYIEKVVELVEDHQRIRDYRANLRDKMKKSPLVDSKGFAGHLSTAFRDIWKEIIKDQ
ncbi:MAG: tetratricopeptide repeat protein [Rhodospirillales bacterium]|nr:tetratricopeptide repeat protein [Rhodospirillales bacterium]